MIILFAFGPHQVGGFLLFLFFSVILGIKIAKKINQNKVMCGIIGFLSSFLVIVWHFISYRSGSPIYGLVFFGVIVALIWLVILEKPWQKVVKQCPYCSGIIPTEAKKCKHCSEWLEKPN